MTSRGSIIGTRLITLLLALTQVVPTALFPAILCINRDGVVRVERAHEACACHSALSPQVIVEKGSREPLNCGSGCCSHATVIAADSFLATSCGSHSHPDEDSPLAAEEANTPETCGCLHVRLWSISGTQVSRRALGGDFERGNFAALSPWPLLCGLGERTSPTCRSGPRGLGSRVLRDPFASIRLRC